MQIAIRTKLRIVERAVAPDHQRNVARDEERGLTTNGADLPFGYSRQPRPKRLLAFVDRQPMKPGAVAAGKFTARLHHPDTAAGVNEVNVPAPIYDNPRAGMSDSQGC